MSVATTEPEVKEASAEAHAHDGADEPIVGLSDKAAEQSVTLWTVMEGDLQFLTARAAKAVREFRDIVHDLHRAASNPIPDLYEYVLLRTGYRRMLAESGLVIAVLVVEKVSGAVVRGPELYARGVAGFDAAEAEIRGDVLRTLEELSPTARADVGEVQEALRTSVRRFFRRSGARRPAVLPVVLEL